MGVNYTAMTFEPIGYGRLNEYVNKLALKIHLQIGCSFGTTML
jgi:hypothetical protein